MKAIQNVSQLFSFSIFSPVQSFFCTLGKVLKPLCFTLSMRDLPMNSVHFEGGMVLTAASVQIPDAGDHGLDLCLVLCMCVFNVLTDENQIAFNFHFLNPT